MPLHVKAEWVSTENSTCPFLYLTSKQMQDRVGIWVLHRSGRDFRVKTNQSSKAFILQIKKHVNALSNVMLKGFWPSSKLSYVRDLFKPLSWSTDVAWLVRHRIPQNLVLLARLSPVCYSFSIPLNFFLPW